MVINDNKKLPISNMIKMYKCLMMASIGDFSRSLINVSSTTTTSRDGDRILVVNCESLIPFKVYTTSYNLNTFNPVYCSSQIFFALLFLQTLCSRKNNNSSE